MDRPSDKILCGRKFYRYVVACMHNCPNPHHCDEFWSFFEAKGVSPAEYYNENGIGDKVMRRVVFDCDRCGKKDIGEMLGLYNTDGERPENRVSPAARLEAVKSAGYPSEVVARLVFHLVEKLEVEKKWQHYCRRCFQRITDCVAAVLDEKRKLPEAEAAVAPAPVPPAAPAPTPVEEPPAPPKPKVRARIEARPHLEPRPEPPTPPKKEPPPLRKEPAPLPEKPRRGRAAKKAALSILPLGRK